MLKPPRVGEVIAVVFEQDGEAELDVTIVRKELPCDRYLARDAEGRYFILFTNSISGRCWDAEDTETDKLNGEE